MSIHFKIFLIAITAILILGCEDPVAKEKATLEAKAVKERAMLQEEVIAIHDEMMPDWHASRKAQTKLEQIMKNETQQKDVSNLEKHQAAHQQLEVVYKAMKDWMNQYKPPTDKTSNEDAISYFKEQKIMVVEMKKVMIENLTAAKKVIDFKTTSI